MRGGHWGKRAPDAEMRGWWRTAVREEGAGLANERRSAQKGCSQRGLRNLAVKDSPRYQCCPMWCSNGRCFRWGQKEEFIGLWINGLPQDSGKENEVWWLGKVIFASYLASMFIAEKVEDLGRNGVAEWMSLVRLMQMAQKSCATGSGYYWAVQCRQKAV